MSEIYFSEDFILGVAAGLILAAICLASIIKLMESSRD